MSTRRFCIAAIALAGLQSCGTMGGADGQVTARSADYRGRFDNALAHAQSAQGVIDDTALVEVIDDAMFDRLPKGERHDALVAAGNAAISRQDFADARDLYLRATRTDPSIAHDWYLLSFLERDLGNLPASRAHALHLIETWPGRVHDLDSEHIAWLVGQVEPQAPGRRALLQALFDHRWNRNQLGAGIFWYELALLQIAGGDHHAASLTIDRIVEPMLLVTMWIDRRFDAVIDHSSPRFDIRHAAAQHVRDLELRVALEPHRLDAVIELANAMLTAGFHAKAATVTGDVIARIESADPGKSLYTDMREEVWVRNIHAIALRRLGRLDEALDTLTRASRLQERDGRNISQALNLGQYLCSLERPGAALSVIPATDESISPYGQLVKSSVQLRAAIQQNDRRGSDAALERLREHQAAWPLFLVDGLLQVDRHDEAAAVLSAQLASPSGRSAALLWCQRFLTPSPLPGDIRVAAARRSLLERHDVRTAIDQVGRIGDWPIFDDLGTE